MVQHDQMQGIRLLVDEILYRTPHMHREFEMILVLSGTLRIACLNEQMEIPEGEMVILNPWQTHEFSTQDDSCTCLFLQILPEVFRDYFPAASRLRFENVRISQMAPPEVQEQLRDLMFQLGNAYFSMEPLYEFVSMRRILLLFELLLRRTKWEILSSEEIQHDTIVQQRLERVMQFVQENYRKKIFLKQVAEREHLSESYMTHFVQEHLNMSFQAYMALTRFAHARQLLENTDLPIVEICHECGFSDRRYLNKICLQQTGMLPKEYRKAQARRDSRRGGTPGLTRERIYSDAEALECLQRVQKGARK